MLTLDSSIYYLYVICPILYMLIMQSYYTYI